MLAPPLCLLRSISWPHSAYKGSRMQCLFVPNCHFGKLKRFRTVTRPCCAHMDVTAVTRGVVNLWVWLKSLQLCCSASATPTFLCYTEVWGTEIGPAAARPAGPAPTALQIKTFIWLGATGLCSLSPDWLTVATRKRIWVRTIPLGALWKDGCLKSVRGL